MPITEKFDSTRGTLVSDYLSNDISTEDYIQELGASTSNYDGYNLIFGDIDNLHYFSNKGTQETVLQPGIHGLSNHLLNTEWPKVRTGKKQLDKIVTQSEVDSSSLFKMMRNTEISADSDLPDTGVGLELERLLSPAFIDPITPDSYQDGSPTYGTRCSTVLLVDWNNNVTFEEESYAPNCENKFQFKFLSA